MLNTVGGGDFKNFKSNSLVSMQKAFVEKAFCIVGDEMKAKMEALGLSEEDLVNIISEENNIDKYLEFIDTFLNHLLELKQFFIKKESERIEKYRPKPHENIANQDELNKQWDEKILITVKSELCNLIFHHEELSTLFSHFSKEGVGIIISCLKKGKIFDLIIALRKGIEKYNFSWDLLIEFFEKVPREVSTSISDQEDPENSFDLLLQTYEVLSKYITNPSLFNDLLKLFILTKDGKLIKLFIRYNDENLEYFKDNFKLLIKLGLIAGKNSKTFFTSPDLIGETVRLIKKNDKLSQSIILGIEKLGPDFIHITTHNSGFIYHILERFPERFIEFCENLKKLADYSNNNKIFYRKSLDFITQFIVDHLDNWEYLIKIGEIFGKNSPGIFSIGKGFINELFRYFPDNYEEILVEVRDVGEHIHGGNEGNFLTYGIKFLAQFLEEGKEKFLETMDQIKRMNDEKLKQNHNTGGIFFEDGLDFVSRYIMHSPEAKDGRWIEISERIIKIINKHYSIKNNDDENFLRQFISGMNNYIDANIIDQDSKLLDELLNFLEKVGGSKDALRVIKSLGEITFDLPDDDEIHDYKALSLKNKLNKNAISYTLAYLLKHKKSKIIPFIGNLSLIKDLNLGININSVLLGGVSLEYKSSEELQELFAGENAESTKIWKYFLKIGGQNSEDIKIWIGQIKQAKKIDKAKAMQYLIKIQNVFAESVLEYFEKIIHKKVHLKFTREFKLSKDFDDSLLNENLFEFYKMYSSTTINKQQAFELIQRYLKGEVYTGNGDILQTYPYNREENRLFLDETLKDKSHIWLSRNERTYDINEENNGEEKVDNIPERIAHHLKVANEKLKLLEIKDEKGDYMTFETHGDLRKYFNLTLKKEIEKYDTNLFNDLVFQIQEIERLLKSNNEQRKKVSKIKIYHELEPLKIAMMGNWVEGSCLSFYHPVKNFYSAITNAVEINKGVFYIEDEHGNVIARILVGIDNNGELEIHPMYLKGNVGINLKEIFYFQYMSELASKLGVTKHGDRDKVQLLFCEEWYSGD